jgi:hypothetical protein
MYVNQHDLRIWDSNNLQAVVEVTKDRTNNVKCKMFCALSNENLFEPFYFFECAGIDVLYVDMSEEFPTPTLEKRSTEDMLF